MNCSDSVVFVCFSLYYLLPSVTIKYLWRSSSGSSINGEAVVDQETNVSLDSPIKNHKRILSHT